MTVKRAKVMGFCMGVRRAVELARRTAAEAGERPVYTLGPLIHNPQAVAELAASGILPIGEAELDARVAGKAVVIRAHGVPPSALARLGELGGRAVDATCPRVLASQRRARRFAAEGCCVVIAGDRDHGEVAGIAGHARAGRAEAGGDPDEACRVVGSPEEAEALDLSGRVALIAQTTIKAEEYEAIRRVLAARHPGLETADSICPCTGERLEALAELARDCEAIIVVGGRNSANTTRLLSSAAATGRPAWLVETADELPPEVFGFASVGITAGASTPDALVDEVEAALLSPSRGLSAP